MTMENLAFKTKTNEMMEYSLFEMSVTDFELNYIIFLCFLFTQSDET